MPWNTKQMATYWRTMENTRTILSLLPTCHKLENKIFC